MNVAAMKLKKARHKDDMNKCGFCKYWSWSLENVNGHKQREHSILIKCDGCEYSNVYKEKVKRPDFKSSFAPFYINPSLENVLVRSRRTTVRENYRETEKAVLDAILGQVISDNHPARDRERQNYHQIQMLDSNKP